MRRPGRPTTKRRLIWSVLFVIWGTGTRLPPNKAPPHDLFDSSCRSALIPSRFCGKHVSRNGWFFRRHQAIRNVLRSNRTVHEAIKYEKRVHDRMVTAVHNIPGQSGSLNRSNWSVRHPKFPVGDRGRDKSHWFDAYLFSNRFSSWNKLHQDWLGLWLSPICHNESVWVELYAGIRVRWVISTGRV